MDYIIYRWQHDSDLAASSSVLQTWVKWTASNKEHYYVEKCFLIGEVNHILEQ